MSIPQAIPNVQSNLGFSTWHDNGYQLFARPVPHILVANSPAAWFENTSSSSLIYTAPTVQVNGIALYQDTVRSLQQAPWSKSPLDIARVAVTEAQNSMSLLTAGVLTQHALMVALGEFAHEIGLISKLEQVPIPQKGVVHAPQAKVLTFFMGILIGIEHLKDLNESAHPLAHDRTVIRAWGLDSLAHYTGISRTMAACHAETQGAIIQVLHETEQPFIDKEVEFLLQKEHFLLWDLDLTHRQVSNTSTTFPDAEFSWQDNKVGLGYDAALVTMASETYGRLFLVGFHYERNTISLPRLQKMILAAEERVKKMPRRRTELVEQRLRELKTEIERQLNWLSAQVAKKGDLLALEQTLPTTVAQLEMEFSVLEAAYKDQNREEKPGSKLAQARRRLAVAQRRLARVPEQLQKVKQVVATHQVKLDQLQAERAALKEHLEKLERDNENNSEPVVIVLRLDAGFGTGPNLTWLIEMGYIIYTKAYNAQVAAKLLAKVKPEDEWTRVGKNAEMIAWDKQSISNCPYPLRIALERFHTPKKTMYSTLIVYRDDGQQHTLPDWFTFYNGRQMIEAGIKETNVVFKMHPLKMRSQGGIVLQEQFVLFAANFIRFAQPWLQKRVARSSAKFDDTLKHVKDLVRVAANTSAWVVGQNADLLVKFDETGAYPGVELRLTGSWRTRPPIRPQRKVRKFDSRNDFVSGCT